jgi:large exoprotein involved in heme utilization and adhesion
MFQGADIRSGTFGDGEGGTVIIRTDRILVSNTILPFTLDGAPRIAAALGIGDDAATRSFVDRQTVITGSAEPGSGGSGGGVSVTARVVEVRDGGAIRSTTAGRGNAGTVTVTADRILVDGDRSIFSTGISSAADEGSTGAAGDVTVAAGDLTVRDEGEISSNSSGLGGAGTVTVNAGSLFISGDGAPLFTGLTTATGPLSQGAGGAVTVSAETVRLVDGGAITAQSEGVGQGGPVTVTSGTLTLENGEISARTAAANGGDVTLAADRIIDLQDSVVTTSVAGGQGSGGNIFLMGRGVSGAPAGETEFVILDNSSLVARAREGNGGNIRILSGQFVPSADSVIDASSELGVSGTVEISGPENDLAGALALLPGAFIDSAPLLASSCAARGGRPTSSLVASGRGVSSPDPDRPLAIPSPEPSSKLLQISGFAAGCDRHLD